MKCPLPRTSEWGGLKIGTTRKNCEEAAQKNRADAVIDRLPQRL